jgi:hypothetical protein
MTFKCFVVFSTRNVDGSDFLLTVDPLNLENSTDAGHKPTPSVNAVWDDTVSALAMGTLVDFPGPALDRGVREWPQSFRLLCVQEF